MSLTEALQLLQLVAFPALAAITVVLLARHRTRPAAFLAVSFCALGLVVLGSRLGEMVGPEQLWRLVSLASLAAFPWLLAAFAWSFAGPLPAWLRSLGLLVLGLCVVVVLTDPLANDDRRRDVFVWVFVGIWMVSSIAAAVRLWRAGGGQQLVRARMRSMALGCVTLTVALLLSAAPTEGAGTASTVVPQVLTLASAVLFLAGFAPPAALRLWWRRRATPRWAKMQADLIAATTLREAAATSLDVARDLVGGDAAVVTTDGRILGTVGASAGRIEVAAARVAAGEPPSDDVTVVRSDDVALVVHRTPYTPMFGQTEQELLSALVLHLQLAIGRAELFEAHQHALAEAQRSQGELQALLVGLSHDLRSPAVAIAGYTRLLRQTTDPDELSEMLDAMEQSSTYLDTLVTAMLELSRIGRTSVETEAVDLGAVVEAVTRRLEVDHPRSHVVVDGVLPTVRMNPTRAEQVVDNLLTNAAKHGGRPDVTITVRAREADDGGAIVAIADDGRGIAEEDRPHVFVPFRRGRSAAHGSGVGLGMVRRILELSNASIELADPEDGTCFEIRFPAEMVERSDTASSPGSDTAASEERRVTDDGRVSTGTSPR
jgi:signal transduction histidine kinase